MVNVAVSRFVPISFSHSFLVKLDNSNFLIWGQQVISAIRGHCLQSFVFNGPSTIPPRFLSQGDAVLRRVSPEFQNWKRQDQLLMSWLLSSMSESILPRFVKLHFRFGNVWSNTLLLKPELRSISSRQFKNTKKVVYY